MAQVQKGDYAKETVYDQSGVNHSKNGLSELINGSIPPIKTKGVKFGHLNIHSIVTKIDELRLLLKHRPFDVLCLNETLCDSTISDEEISIDGFSLLRNDRTRHGGGVAIYISNNFKHTRRHNIEPDMLECVLTEVKYSNYKPPIIVGAFYRPPNTSVDFFDKFDEVLATVSAESKECILLGDFNCDFSTCNILNTNTDNLKFYTSLYGFSQMITSPTRITSHSSTTIDLIFVNNPDVFTDSGVFCTSISDHFLCYSVRCFNSKPYVQEGHNYMEYRPVKKMKTQDFLQDLKDVPWDTIASITDIDIAWRTWLNAFMEIVDQHAPLRKKRIRHNACPWITEDIVRSMTERDQIHKAATKHNCQQLWDKYRSLRNTVTHKLQKQKRDYYCGLINDNAGNSKKIWSSLKAVIPKQVSILPNSIEVNGTECSETDVIANAFNDYFVTCAESVTQDLPDSIPFVSSDVPHGDDCIFNLRPVSSAFVQRIILTMDVTKATGDDQLSCYLLKIACPVILQSLTKILNMSLVHGYVPDGLKSAKIVPIFKSGNTSDIGNYRPISILPIVSKILERAVYTQLYEYINEHDLLHPNQSGFRPMHSTTTILAKMVNQWSRNVDGGDLTGVAFIDLRKAFDTVNHDILLAKLSSLGCSASALKWFSSYLSGRTQRVYLNKASSKPQVVVHGVPQGSILGPLLFSVYVNSMPLSVSNGIIDMYADDTTLTVHGKTTTEVEHKLSTALMQISEWLTRNRLVLNYDKTNVMVIGSKTKLRDTADFKVEINGIDLRRVHKTKCLGVMIDDELKWTDQVGKVVHTVQAKLGVIRRVKPYIPVHAVRLLYNAFILPHFDYCSQIWSERFNMHTNKLLKLQKRAARLILGEGYDTPSKVLFNTLGWMPLQSRFIYQRAVLMYKCINNLAPFYLTKDFSKVSDTHHHCTRQATDEILSIPHIKSECFKHSPLVTGATVWNSLNNEIRSASSVKSFKTMLKNILDT